LSLPFILAIIILIKANRLLFNKNRIYNINTGNNWDLGNSDNQIIANPLTTPIILIKYHYIIIYWFINISLLIIFKSSKG